jgi:hypothetical protein
MLAGLAAGAAVAPRSGAPPQVGTSSPAHSPLAREVYRLVAAAGDVPPQNPSQSLAPSPDFTGDGTCGAQVLDDSDGCLADVVAAINNGRPVLEAMAPLTLDLSAFEAMTIPEQLFAIADLERTDRGLAPLAGLTTQLDDLAQTAAANDDDPILSSSTLVGGASVSSWGSNWAGGTSNALGSDYYWMYDDGIGSNNEGCTTSSDAACWGHRDNILGTFASNCGSGAEQYMGAGDTSSGSSYGPSFAEIIVGACGPAPTDVVYTWAQAQQALNGGPPPTTTTTTTSTTSTTTSTTTTTTTTQPPPPPGTPSAPQDVTAASSATKGVVVSWLAPADTGGTPITGYAVYRARAAGAEVLYRTVTCDSGACTFTNTHARTKRMFFYTVAAVNAAGTGPLSPQVSARAH